MSAATVVPAQGAIRQRYDLSCKTLSSPHSYTASVLVEKRPRPRDGPTVPKTAICPAGSERHLSACSTSVIGRPCPPRHLQSLQRGLHGLSGPPSSKGNYDPRRAGVCTADPAVLNVLSELEMPRIDGIIMLNQELHPALFPTVAPFLLPGPRHLA